MIRRILFVSCFIAVLCPIAAHADCGDFVQSHLYNWLHQLHPGRVAEGGELVVCRVWPADPTRTLVAVPLVPESTANDRTVSDIDILVANSETGEIVSHGFQHSAFSRQVRDMAFDTAPYQISSDQRAFGLRMHYWGSGSNEDNWGASTRTLSLYVVEGQQVRPVLENLVIDTYMEKWDGELVDGQCTAGQIDDMKRTLAIGTRDQSGHAILRIVEKSVQTVYGKVDGCWHGQNSRPLMKTEKDMRGSSISYRDGSYEVPQALRMIPREIGPIYPFRGIVTY
jgi:hypothetical protein